MLTIFLTVDQVHLISHVLNYNSKVFERDESWGTGIPQACEGAVLNEKDSCLLQMAILVSLKTDGVQVPHSKFMLIFCYVRHRPYEAG